MANPNLFLVEAKDDDEPVFYGFTQAQLSAAFRLVADEVDWKEPIEEFFPDGEPAPELEAQIDAAVIFYTGSVAVWQAVDGGRIVTALGYYLAMVH